MATSPSGWAIFCMAVGATHTGKSILLPRIAVEVSIDDTFRRTRGRNFNLTTKNNG